MAVTFSKGDITKFSEGILINPINCKKLSRNVTTNKLNDLFPENAVAFDKMCDLGKIKPSSPHIVKLHNGKCIINVGDTNIEDFSKAMTTISKNYEKIKEHCGGNEGIAVPEFSTIKFDLINNKIKEIFSEKSSINSVLY